jgi:lysophospholipase L1-like esterase
MAKMTNTRRALLAVGVAVLFMSSGLAVLFFSCRAPTSLIRVACVGDSITEDGYPSELQVMLGAEYDVGDFGASGSTVSFSTEKPYIHEAVRLESKFFQPSIVVIMLGTNDAQADAESFGNFSEDYTQLVGEYLSLASDPVIWLVKPPPIFENHFNLSETSLEQGVIPQIEQVARDLNLSTIDVNAIMAGHPEYFMDGVHPSSEGTAVIANEIIQAITASGVSATPF